MKKVTVKLNDRSYDILIAKGAIKHLPGNLKRLVPVKKILLVSSKAIYKHYGTKITKLLKSKKFEVTPFFLPEGERAKSKEELFRIYAACLKAGLDRFSGLIALGGGAVGDVAGFAASTYLRGIAFINIPTTLLAQVDSAIGGKTAINLKEGKNLAGTFYQPGLVVSDTELLKSLPEREYISSLAEIIKYGVIASPSLFKYLEKNAVSVLKRNTSALEKIIAESSLIKAQVVEADERELTGLRAILNYGHTFAHAYEKNAGFGKLLHGEAVAIGMCDAARLAEKKKMLSAASRKRIESLIQKLKLPISAGKFNFPRKKIVDAMLKDKKKRGEKVSFILPIKIGKVAAARLSPKDVI